MSRGFSRKASRNSSLKVSFAADSARSTAEWQAPSDETKQRQLHVASNIIERESRESRVSFADDFQETKETAPRTEEGILCPNCLRLQEAKEGRHFGSASTLASKNSEDEELGALDSGSSTEVERSDCNGATVSKAIVEVTETERDNNAASTHRKADESASEVSISEESPVHHYNKSTIYAAVEAEVSQACSDQ